MATTAWVVVQDYRMPTQVAGVSRPEYYSWPPIWFMGFVACVIVFGISPGLPLMATAYLLHARQVRKLWAVCAGIGIALVMDILLVELSGLDLFRGLLIENLV